MTTETLEMKPTAFLDFHHEYVEVCGRYFRVTPSGWVQRWNARHLSDRERAAFEADPAVIPEDRWTNCRANAYGTRREPVINVSYEGFSEAGKAIKCNKLFKVVELVAAAYFKGYNIGISDCFTIARKPGALDYSVTPQELEVYDNSHVGRMTYETNPLLQKTFGARFFARHRKTGNYHYVLPGEFLTEPDSHYYLRDAKHAFLEKLAIRGDDFLEIYRASVRDGFSSADLGRWEVLLSLKERGKLSPDVSTEDNDPAALPVF